MAPRAAEIVEYITVLKCYIESVGIFLVNDRLQVHEPKKLEEWRLQISAIDTTYR